MKYLSKWASRHYWSARVILVLIHLLLAVLALTLGYLLATAGWSVSEEFLLVAAVSFLGIFAYFLLSEKKKTHYRFRKIRESIVLVSGILLLTLTSVDLFHVESNQLLGAREQNGHYAQFVALKKEAVDRAELRAEKKAAKKANRREKKIFRKQIKAKIREYLQSNAGPKPLSAGGAAGLILLTILGGLFLMTFSLALGCSTSCNGNEGLGTAILLLGVLGSIALMVLFIIKISKRRKATREAENAVGT